MDNVFLCAGAEGLLDILKLAIAAQADTRLTNRFGGTALIPAAERGHVEIVKELLAHTDVNVNHANNLGWTALLEAIVLSNGGARHQQIVRLLIDHGANVNLADQNGVTPLQHAQTRGFKEIERILLQAGAYADRRADPARDRQLIAAAKQGDAELVRRLLAQGASVHARTEVVRLLVAADANVNLADANGVTPLTHAQRRGFQHIVTILGNAR